MSEFSLTFTRYGNGVRENSTDWLINAESILAATGMGMKMAYAMGSVDSDREYTLVGVQILYASHSERYSGDWKTVI